MNRIAQGIAHAATILTAGLLVGCSAGSARAEADAGTGAKADVEFAPSADGESMPSMDTWIQVVGDGFGSPSQDTVPEFEEFDGYLYAATSPTGAGLAKLYRSATGDPEDWTEVTPALEGDHSIHAFAKTTKDGGYLWCGTGGGSAGAMVFRTQDGTNWTPIVERGFGNTPPLTGTSPHFVVYQGPGEPDPHLYVGMGTHGGGIPGQVWRTPYANSNPKSDWTKLVDFSNADGDSYSNDDVDTISYFYVWKDRLYFSTNGGAQLWQSDDGTTFAQNEGVGNGFGVPSNFVIASLEVFNDALYATTTNSTLGGQLWRTSDGKTWQMITGDAFGKGNQVTELRSVRASFGKLWLTGYTDTKISAGTPVWRSDDGENWVQSNEDGFGDLNNNGQNAVTIGFGDYQYWGGPNYVSGGQIWRAKIR